MPTERHSSKILTQQITSRVKLLPVTKRFFVFTVHIFLYFPCFFSGARVLQALRPALAPHFDCGLYLSASLTEDSSRLWGVNQVRSTKRYQSRNQFLHTPTPRHGLTSLDKENNHQFSRSLTSVTGLDFVWNSQFISVIFLRIKLFHSGSLASLLTRCNHAFSQPFCSEHEYRDFLPNHSGKAGTQGWF